MAVLLGGCGRQGQQADDQVREQYEQLDKQLTVGMQLDGDSVLHVIDSLEFTGILPTVVADYERGTCYSLMEKRRLGEYYYKKAVAGDELFQMLPDAYFRSSTNLAILLSGKNDEQGALRVATQAYDRLKTVGSNVSCNRWGAALLFNIGSSQLRLGHQEEGLQTLKKSWQLVETLVEAEATAENLRMQATLAVNTATIVGEAASDEAMPWIIAADDVIRKLPYSRELSPALIDMLHGKAASLMAIWCASHDRPGDAEYAFRRFMSTDYSKAPASLNEQLTYLEKAGRWEEAVSLLPGIWKLHKELGMEKDMDYLCMLAEGITVCRRSGRDRDALELADSLASLADSVRLRQHQDMAEELAIIYETQQKEDEIEHQQSQLRWQQVVAVAVFLILLLVFLTAYTLYRRQTTRRLAVALARAEESSCMKTKFIQQISHEIRTPLNILSGFTQILTTPGMELDEQEMQDINRRITDNTARITGLVNKMLELSEAGSQTVIEQTDDVTPAEIALRAVEASAVREVQHVAFREELSPEAGSVTIRTNAQMAVRALEQLLDNAKKFTHPPVESDNLRALPGEKSQVALKVRVAGDQVVFSVEDGGCGVPPQEAEHIFEEFVQLDEFYEGTGIGLTVARSIARRMGGDVVLDTTYTGGARFMLLLQNRTGDRQHKGQTPVLSVPRAES